MLPWASLKHSSFPLYLSVSNNKITNVDKGMKQEAALDIIYGGIWFEKKDMAGGVGLD